MMQKFTKPTAFLTAVLLACAAAVPVPAAAKFDITVSIDQKDVSLTELQNLNYQVPVFVRLSQNVNLNAIEFGIDVDSRCRFDAVTKSNYAALYGEGLGLEMASSSPGTDTYIWLSWASTVVYYSEDSSNLLMLLVTVPQSAQADDTYQIHYLTQSPSNAAKNHVWYNFGLNTDYVKTGSIFWDDGWIHITEAEPEPEYTPGDVTLDGKVNILDVISVNRAVLGKETLTSVQEKAADMNGNGVPDSVDSLTIMKMIVGLL